MTTQALTSNQPGVSALSSLPHGDLGGLPDEASLNQLANEFFAVLPSAAPLVLNAAAAAVGQRNGHVPAAPAELAGITPPSAPSLAPTAKNVTAVHPAGIPSPRLSSAPGTHEHIPAGYAAALPQLENVGSAHAGSTLGANQNAPYYFLQEPNSSALSGNSSSHDPLDTLAAQATAPVGRADDRVLAQSFGLPGATDLQHLLGDLYPRNAAAPTAVSPSSSPQYYFLSDPAVSGIELAPSNEQSGLATYAKNGSAYAGFDVHAIRRDFPILAERVNGKQLVWFDNAATTHKPQAVIDRIAYFYAHENSNIHRAAHELAARATDAYEGARNTVARFIGAASPNEIIFVRGATEAINLVAQTFGKKFIGAGDEIIVSHLEHHANIVPWQQLAAEKGAVIRVIPVDESGQILLDEYRKLLNSKTKLVAVTQVSNALGTVTPIKEIVDLAHLAGAKALVDGAQAVSHMRVNVQALDADFYVFSGHKIFGPTGIGVVYGKADLLEQLPPWQGGGNMIEDVTFERTIYHGPPTRFEAGTGNIADAVGLGAALEYLERIGMEKIGAYEHALLDYATHYLKPIPGVRLVGTAHEKASVLSFVLDGYKTEEVGKALNEEGIAVRSGHHCAQPILRRFGLEATVRPSLAFYNTCEEVDRFIAVIRRLSAARR